MTNIRVLSIDPGYERLGLAILDKDSKTNKPDLVFSSCFKTKNTFEFQDRLLQIGEHLESVIKEYKPDKFAIENLFLSNNQKTAMRVAETRGVLIYIAKKYNLPVYELTPLQIKLSITGNGKSDKVGVEKMIKLILPNLKKESDKLDDEFDAIACGLSYFALEKSL